MSKEKKETSFQIVKDIYANRKLANNLAKNDFKTKYAGSYLGIIWAFIQPIVTILVYWFVFQVAFQSQPVNDCPFVLWLVAGLTPWFFFSDAWNGGTTAFIDYSYLVKKVVFKIEILPYVKTASALIVHFVFIVFMFVIYCCNGYYPNLYWLQLIYYTVALFVFSLALCYVTSAIMVFFKDLTQLITIILQVGVWITPIMWDINRIQSPIIQFILRLNPMYYIVGGYRESMITKQWFWQSPRLAIYFWVVTLLTLWLGFVLLRKLKVHFADVL